MKKKFEHSIGAHVELAMSKEKGSVIARAKFETGVRQYLVRYLAANGRQVEAWFDSSALRTKNVAQALTDIFIGSAAEAPSVLLPHVRINDAAIESVKLKVEPDVAKPSGDELAAVKDHLSALSNSVAALQATASDLSGQFAVLADRFSVSGQ